MKKLTISVGVILLGLLLITSTCSDKSTGNDRTEGDYQDESFLQAQSLVVGFTDSLLTEINVAFWHIIMDDHEPGPLAADSASATYDPETCWWELYTDGIRGDTSFIQIDSLKFIDESGCQQYPDIGTITQFDYRTFGDIFISDGQETIHATGFLSAAISGFQSDFVIVDCEAALQASVSYDFVGTDLDYDAENTDLNYVRDDLYSGDPVYPVSGGLPLTIKITNHSWEGSPATYWYFSITFSENGYNVHAESGDYFWNWGVLYGG